MAPMTVEPPPGSRPGGALATLARAAAREPFTRRAVHELLFCLIGAPLGFCLIPVLYLVFVVPLALALLAPGLASTWVSAVGLIPALLLLLVLATRVARGFGAAHRRLAVWLLREQVAPPPPLRPDRGIAGRLKAGLRDGPGWRAVAYTLLKLPAAVLESYAAFLWVAGLINVTYPFWWGLFRNHPANVQLRPVPVSTPFPGRLFHVGTFAGSFLALVVGAAMVLAAPWAARAVTSADRWLIRGLLGPGRLAQRVRDLEQTRARAIDDTAALLRQIERDLHDGAQIRLATLAMHLGMAKEKLGDGGGPTDVTAVRELVDAAHRGAKDALVELRDLAKGFHPPVLDNGLADALATLAAGSAIPVELTTDIPVRPTPAIETIAYFCAAELLANAAKHSSANRIEIQAAGREGVLRLSVTDDGTGGRTRPAAAACPGSHSGSRPWTDASRSPAHRAARRRSPPSCRCAHESMPLMRVVIAEDAALFREGLIRLLEDRGHQVCAAVADGGALLAAVAEHHPDVAVVDVRMPPTHTDEGLRAALDLRRDHPATGVLVFSQYIETRYAARLLEGSAAGVGYLLKGRVADVAEFADSRARPLPGSGAIAAAER